MTYLLEDDSRTYSVVTTTELQGGLTELPAAFPTWKYFSEPQIYVKVSPVTAVLNVKSDPISAVVAVTITGVVSARPVGGVR